MRKYIVISFLLIPFLFGCLNLLGPEEPDDEKEKGSIQVTVQISSDNAIPAELSNYVIKIINESKDVVSTKTSNTLGVFSFNDLNVGEYIVKANGLNSSGDVIFSGLKATTVTKDSTANVSILMEEVPEDEDPDKEDTEEKGSISINLPGSSDSDKSEPSSYTVSIYNDKDELVTTKSGTPDSNVEVDNLLPGSYLVKVDGKDSDGTVIMSGSDSVSVTAGKSTSATIQMEYLTGDIDITITLPSN